MGNQFTRYLPGPANRGVRNSGVAARRCAPAIAAYLGQAPAVSTTKAGSLRLPRCGTGARYGRRSRAAAGPPARSGPRRAGLRLRESDHAAETQIETQVQSLARFRRAAAKAVHDAGLPAVLAAGQRIVPGFARMDHDGLSARPPASTVHENVAAAPRAAKNRSGSRARFRRWPAPWDRPPVPQLREGLRAALDASCGCTPTVA